MAKHPATAPTRTLRPVRARAAKAVVVEPFQSRAEEVYRQVKQDIANFRLVPGDRFTEHELCARLDVSRTPVRQALFRLQQDGLVEVMFRSGWRVLPFDFDKFDQLYDLRMVLETTAVHRLCTEADKIDLLQLDDPQQRLDAIQMLLDELQGELFT